MKRIVLLFSLCSALFSIQSFAQIPKGSKFLGGSVGFYNSNSEINTPGSSTQPQEVKQSGWSFRPQFGKFVATNKVLGLFAEVGGSKNRQISGNSSLENENSNVGGGIFYRQYYLLAKKFYLFGEADLGISFGKQQTINDNGTTRFTSAKTNLTDVGVSVSPGLSFAASEKLHLELSLNDLFRTNYASSEGEVYNPTGSLLQTTKNSTFSASANANGFSQLAIGLRWILK